MDHRDQEEEGIVFPVEIKDVFPGKFGNEWYLMVTTVDVYSNQQITFSMGAMDYLVHCTKMEEIAEGIAYGTKNE